MVQRNGAHRDDWWYNRNSISSQGLDISETSGFLYVTLKVMSLSENAVNYRVQCSTVDSYKTISIKEPLPPKGHPSYKTISTKRPPLLWSHFHQKATLLTRPLPPICHPSYKTTSAKRPPPPKAASPLIRLDFRCTLTVKYYCLSHRGHFSYKATISLQKGWPYKRGDYCIVSETFGVFVNDLKYFINFWSGH